MSLVFSFDHPHDVAPVMLKDLLGGKGANLAEMTSVLGLPVPPGFTITTDACRAFLVGGWPSGLQGVIDEHVARLEAAMGKRLGDGTDPLLVSVRSGAKFSMPGMMDTVLNLGLNDESVVGLARQTDDERFALDSYRRFMQMYAKIVLGVPAEDLDAVFETARESSGASSDAAIPAEVLARVLDDYRSIIETHTGSAFPAGATGSVAGRHRSGVRLVAHATGHRLSTSRGHRRRPGHGRQRAGDGVRQSRRPLGHRRRVHPQPVDGRGRPVRRLPRQRPGRRRGGGHPQHPTARRPR